MTAELEVGALRHDLAFPYRLYGRPESAGLEAIVLLHGSGVDETTMAPLGAEIAPEAASIAVRGRVQQEDGWRWFERITPTRFGQQSIKAEASAFADFIPKLAEAHGLDLSRTTFLGYSNGANLISSVMLLHPGLVERAVLLRAMPVLDEVPPADLSATRVLVISGAADVTYGPFAQPLAALLSGHGAEVEAHIVAAGHEFGAGDVKIVRDWLAPPPISVA
jgi:phospholipase/carboxylesterase